MQSRSGWQRKFNEPAELPTTPAEAIAYLATTLPRAERNHPKVEVAADHLT
jgi:hypothetical protein